jgi:fructosamine-3-kinase
MIRGGGDGDNLLPSCQPLSLVNDDYDALLARLSDGLHRVTLGDGSRAVAKVRRLAPAGFFEAEARGLDALRASRTLRVPGVRSVGADAILLEDLGSGRPRHGDWERAGTDLARLHRASADAFGFEADGWCGDSPQDNSRDADGHRFFAERRLRAQALRARAGGRLDESDFRRIDRLCDRLADLVPPMPPVLVHGDLWIANLHACANGELALIDAGAVHHGWAECDLAMLTLFGEPPAAFFAAYEAESGIDARWRERAPVYNLYHLLNHLNLFGAGYLDPVRSVLRRYG